MTHIDYADARSESFTYDPAGNRTTMTSTEGTTRWTYDPRDRVIGETQPSGAVVEHRYDPAGNRILTRHIQGTAISENHYTFDARHRLVSAQENAGVLATYRYDLAGNLTTQTQGGTLTRYGYDPRNRLIEIHSTVGTTTTQRYRYTLDAVGRKAEIEEIDVSGEQHITDYSYDPLGRLSSEAEMVAGQIVHQASYVYDNVGNRIRTTINGVTETATFDTNDRLLTQGDAQYQYDANGNQTRKTTPSQIVDYHYDARGWLVEATDIATATAMRMDYDPDGNRIARRIQIGSTPEVETRFVIDRSFGLPEVIAELDANDQVTARYLHGMQLIQQTTDVGPHSVLRYPLQDGLGSTRYLVDAVGGVSDTLRFDAWGQVRQRDGTTPAAHRFAGEYWEESLELSFNRARWYAPDQARFTQMDSFSGFAMDPLSLHKYIYANTDPLNGVDPSGWFTLGGMMSGISMNSVLAATAVSFGSCIAVKHGKQLANGLRSFAIWDAVAVLEFRARATQTEADDSAAAAIAAASALAVSPCAHHVIPVYLCGSMNQELSTITHAQHVAIHAEIGAIKIALDGAEEFANKTVGRARSGDILRIAQTKAGRMSITNALDMVYRFGGWWRQGVRPIGDVLQRERASFESGENTSLPWCSRDGLP